jgi:hypothetical protein
MRKKMINASKFFLTKSGSKIMFMSVCDLIRIYMNFLHYLHQGWNDKIFAAPDDLQRYLQELAAEPAVCQDVARLCLS